MSVYVDPLFGYGGSKSFRWKTSCHMYADTLDELHDMAARIGMRRAWFQDKNRKLPHYDLVPARRKLAVQFGAVEHDFRQMVAFKRSRLGLAEAGEVSRLSQDGMLLRSGVEVDLAGSSSHLHLEDVPILKVSDSACAPGELRQRFIAIEERGARQLGTHAVSVEENDVPALVVVEAHQNLAMHGEILGEAKAKISTNPQVIEKAGA
jgi:hypothetical protein